MQAQDIEIQDIEVTADVVALAPDTAGVWHVLLIERGDEPYKGREALPGGYVRTGELTEHAAARELLEETGITAPANLARIDIFDAPQRDPRGRVISVAYLARLDTTIEPTAGDDAAAAHWIPVATALSSSQQLAFDHRQILTAGIGLLTKQTDLLDTVIWGDRIVGDDE